MQTIDEQKREKILRIAAELFATQPFHKVLLSDVAEAAAVGKGTLYIYFKGKEDLYLSVIYSAFSGLVDRLRERITEECTDPMENMEVVIRETVRFAYQNPHLFQVMRTIPALEASNQAKWDAKRTELKALIESVIHQGIARGIFHDTHPEFTARYIPGFVRAVLRDGIDTIDCETLTEHILHFVIAAITSREDAC